MKHLPLCDEGPRVQFPGCTMVKTMKRGLPRAADMGASGPAIAWSLPSRGITGDLGRPFFWLLSPPGAVGNWRLPPLSFEVLGDE